MCGMESADLLKLLGGGSTVGALLFLLYLVGMRIVAALDRIATKVDDHGSRLERVEVKLDFALGEQDEQPRRTRTPARGVPVPR